MHVRVNKARHDVATSVINTVCVCQRRGQVFPIAAVHNATTLINGHRTIGVPRKSLFSLRHFWRASNMKNVSFVNGDHYGERRI